MATTQAELEAHLEEEVAYRDDSFECRGVLRLLSRMHGTYGIFYVGDPSYSIPRIEFNCRDVKLAATSGGSVVITRVRREEEVGA